MVGVGVVVEVVVVVVALFVRFVRLATDDDMNKRLVKIRVPIAGAVSILDDGLRLGSVPYLRKKIFCGRFSLLCDH